MRSYVVAAFVFALLGGTPVLAAMPGVKFIDCELAPAEAARGACHIPYDKAFSSAEADDDLSTTDTATATSTDSSTTTATTTSYDDGDDDDDDDDDLKLARRTQAVGDNINTDAFAQRSTTRTTGTAATTTRKHAATASAVVVKRNIATATTVTPAAATVNAKRTISGETTDLRDSEQNDGSDSSASDSSSSTAVSSTSSATNSSAAAPTIPPMLPIGMKRNSGASDTTDTTTQSSEEILKRGSGPDRLSSMLAGNFPSNSVNGATVFLNLNQGQASTTTVYYSGEKPTEASSADSGNDDDGEGHFVELDLLNFGGSSTTSSDASQTDA